MRGMQFDFSGVSPTVFRRKIQDQTIGQLEEIYKYLGFSLVAPFFFLSLLHQFKRPETGLFRWGILAMWLSALFGMSVFGMDSEQTILKSFDLHVLFIPLLIFYGMGFALVLWTRLEIKLPLLRVGFIAFIYLVSGLPLINTLLAGSQGRVQWPPYVPPYIAILNTWTTEKEVIASDMPWAVAWYADRKSLWLPLSIADFVSLNDYNQLGGSIVGLYLTPVTGNAPFVSGVVKGEYKEWAPFIMRNVLMKDFPLKAVTACRSKTSASFTATATAGRRKLTEPPRCQKTTSLKKRSRRSRAPSNGWKPSSSEMESDKCRSKNCWSDTKKE